MEDEPDPRFTLANERTLLAWLRTSLAFVVTGLGVAALTDYTDQPWLPAIAAIGCAVGSVTTFVAYLRWRRIEQALRLKQPLPRPSGVFVLVVGVVLGFLTFVVLVGGALR